MKKILITCTLIGAVFASNNVAAANDSLVAVCATGLMVFAKDINKVNSAFTKADNQQNARQLASNRIDQIGTRPDGGFTERGLKQLMMDHHRACQAVGIRSAID